VAVACLAALGAAVRKIEPPAGDPLQGFAPAWFDALHASVARETIDLKSPAGRQQLDAALSVTDVLVTSQRPSALARLGLDRERVAAVAPALRVVRIVGDTGDPERPGHDLTYLADAGLLGDRLPPTLMADMAGADHVVSAVLLALRAAPGSWRDVGLRQAVAALAAPLVHGLTAPGGPVGGGLAAYGVYAAADGHVAVAALEPRFRDRLYAALGLPRDAPLGEAFAARTTAHWIAFAREHDLPIAVVRRG
jgi:crotonobetainyl-CoA:carnitine CoA-transferase CaiB-like acyl-CoA transferase